MEGVEREVRRHRREQRPRVRVPEGEQHPYRRYRRHVVQGAGVPRVRQAEQQPAGQRRRRYAPPAPHTPPPALSPAKYTYTSASPPNSRAVANQKPPRRGRRSPRSPHGALYFTTLYRTAANAMNTSSSTLASKITV